MLQADTIHSSPIIGWLEKKNDDFPYYDGNPVNISGVGWLIVLLGVLGVFVSLFLLQRIFTSGLGGFIPAIAYVVVPLVALAFVSNGHWKAIFRRLRPVDFLWIIGIFILNWVVTIALGFLVVSLFDAQPNPAGGMIAAATTLEKVYFFLKSAIQLLGEEIFTILPFLAAFWFCTKRLGLGRGISICVAALLVAAIFAIAHLPTYQWNYGQAFVALVPVRIVLLLPYIITKNIWVSTGVHIVNDYTIFGLPLLFAGVEMG